MPAEKHDFGQYPRPHLAFRREDRQGCNERAGDGVPLFRRRDLPLHGQRDLRAGRTGRGQYRRCPELADRKPGREHALPQRQTDFDRPAELRGTRDRTDRAGDQGGYQVQRH